MESLEHARFEITDQQIEGDDYFAVIEPLHFSVSIYDGPEQYEKDLARFTKEQRLVFACHWYLSEVNNGGHDQFYDNNTGIVWKDAREGFAAIGVPEVSAIIDESTQRIKAKPSLVREERQEQIELSDANFRDLDDRLFQLEEKVDLNEQMLAYIRAHRQQFYFSGTVNNL
ncbi:MAG TPA: DMP19 family protein [Pyrinomonadaceae bacterium]|nr:DMP19 family protein [Pyrinomonadaceae bacterium]